MQNFKKLIILVLAAFGILLGGASLALQAYMLGRRDAMVDQCKTYYVNLEGKNYGDNSGLREYSKARYYYLSEFIPDSIFVGYLTDFGPVQSEFVSSMVVGKEDDLQRDYQLFMERKARLSR